MLTGLYITLVSHVSILNSNWLIFKWQPCIWAWKLRYDNSSENEATGEMHETPWSKWRSLARLLLWTQVQVFCEHRDNRGNLLLAIHLWPWGVRLKLVGDSMADTSQNTHQVHLRRVRSFKDLSQGLDKPWTFCRISPWKVALKTQRKLSYNSQVDKHR